MREILLANHQMCVPFSAKQTRYGGQITIDDLLRKEHNSSPYNEHLRRPESPEPKDPLVSDVQKIYHQYAQPLPAHQRHHTES